MSHWLPGAELRRMLLWAALTGFLIGPILAWMWDNVPNVDHEGLTTLLTLASGFGATFLAFGKEERSLWFVIKVSVAAALAYYFFVLLSTYVLADIIPVEEIILLPLVLIFGYFAPFLLGLMLGWLARVLWARFFSST